LPFIKPYQALAVQTGDGLHLVQQATSASAIRLQIAFLHLPEILESLVNRHSVFDGHRSLGNIFF
jgi:hypothetical protein